jgi:hypothetical protein
LRRRPPRLVGTEAEPSEIWNDVGVISRRRAGVVTRTGWSSAFLRLDTPAFHEFSAEDALRLELIVRAATQAKILGRGRAAACEWNDVIELQEFGRWAAVPGFARECAPAAIALPHGALDLG